MRRLAAFAPPYNHPPRFQTSPVTAAVAGEPYVYDADAIDLDVDDTITSTIESGPARMTVDPVTGEIAYAPTVESPSEVAVTLRASDDRGAVTDQTYTLVTAGALGPLDAGMACGSSCSAWSPRVRVVVAGGRLPDDRW